MYIIMPIGYHDDRSNKTFGYFKERQYIAQSNFNFEFVAEVACESTPQSSGFLLSVTREGSDGSRYNYTIQRNHCVLHFNFALYTEFVL